MFQTKTYSGRVAKHSEHGLRFMQLVQSLDNILDRYDRIVPLRGRQGDFPPTPTHSAYGVTFDIAIPYLKVHLREWVRCHTDYDARVKSTRSENVWCVPLKGHRVKEDAVRALPRPIVACLKGSNQVWQAEKVTVTWIVCWLERRLPNTAKNGWESFECSHLCICGGTGMKMVCLSSDHLFWESKAVNQSRGGNPLCFRDCTHCNRKLCHCQGLHDPPCL
jgi:hypothetical protein